MKLLIILLIIYNTLKDTSIERLNEDKKDWERIMGRKYE